MVALGVLAAGEVQAVSPTLTKLTGKTRGECARCHGAAGYVVKREGERPVRLCVWCARKVGA